MRLPRTFRFLVCTVSALLCAASAFAAAPLKIAYSDWPGWTALAIAEQKGWFREAGVDVDLLWFEYGPSMEAFTAGKVDAVTMTNGDALVTGAGGARNVAILVTDYSNGNDMIVARPGINSLKELKGRKVGIEVGFVVHLLLLNGLKKNGLSESDVELVPTPTNQTPQVLASGQVDAIGAWQPNSGEALKAVPGSKAVYTSADEPGLIYDMIAVTPQSLARRRADWVKVVRVWDKVVAYLADPATREDGIRIMAARAGIDPKEYAKFLPGTRLLTLAESSKFFSAKTDSFDSLVGSSKIADEFNVKNDVYKESQDVAAYLDPSLTLEALAAPPAAGGK
ncbi:ABC transporter substrate-binding protein [Opitutaceae bacterium TAV5]|nr:ABC transporter substrate-binding protein [Opitutaceae bacterium TAV5]